MSAEPKGMSEVWPNWQGHVVDGVFPLNRYLGRSDHSGVFLTELVGRRPSEVAIKLVPAITGLAEAHLSRWDLAGGLAHPHLLGLLATGRCQLDGLPYLYVVMEYADQTLAQLLEHRAMSEDEAREMLPPMLGALAFLHNRNLVQGQLKPANILVVGDQLRLASDTIRAVSEAAASINMVSVYDPPEVVHDGTCSTAGDIWALGVTLFESLTRSSPFGLDVRREGVVLPPDFSPTFREMVLSCLSRRPYDRPKAAEIEARLRGQPVGTEGSEPAAEIPTTSAEVAASEAAASAIPAATQPAVSQPAASATPAAPAPVASQPAASPIPAAATTPAASKPAVVVEPEPPVASYSAEFGVGEPAVSPVRPTAVTSPAGTTAPAPATPAAPSRRTPTVVPATVPATARRTLTPLPTPAAAAPRRTATGAAAAVTSPAATPLPTPAAAPRPSASAGPESPATLQAAATGRPQPTAPARATVAAVPESRAAARPAAAPPPSARPDDPPPLRQPPLRQVPPKQGARPAPGPTPTLPPTPAPARPASRPIVVLPPTDSLSRPPEPAAEKSAPIDIPFAQQPRKGSSLLPLLFGAAFVIALVWFGMHVLEPLRHTAASRHHASQAARVPPPSEAAPVGSNKPAPPPQVSSAAPATKAAATATPVVVTNTKPVEMPAVDALPSGVHEEIPKVPQRILRSIRGHVRVSVRLIVDKDGAVFAALVDDPGPSPYFARVALEAAKKWTFPPQQDVLDAGAAAAVTSPAGTPESRLELVSFDFTREGATGKAVSLQ